MNYQAHNLQQGSPEWHAFRAEHFGASEAAAMLGLSKYTSRTELLRQKSTGISKEVDANTQAIFDRGHATEALARPIIEAQIGAQLSPVTLSKGKLSCSCDGLTFDDSIAWEHKQKSTTLFAAVARINLPEEHQPQCQQILMITGAEKLIFTVSSGTEQDMMSMEVLPDPAWFERILAGWRQFERDLAEYQHVEHIPASVAAPTRDLPVLSIQVQGSISLIDNLAVFGAQLTEFVAQINKEPTDDQGFADAEAAVKTLQAAQDALEAAEASALAQTSSIDKMRRTVKLYADTARTTRLMLEKMVKARKESIRIEIVQGGKDALAERVATLNKRLAKVQLPTIQADFAGAIKGKKTIASLHEAVNNELLRAEREANALADKIEINLNSLRELAKDHALLFSDTPHLVMKANDDLVALIKVRIAEHQAAEAAKEEATRLRIQQEEEAKARAKVEAERRAAIQAETAHADAKLTREVELAQQEREAAESEEKRKAAQLEQSAELKGLQPLSARKPTPVKAPSREQLIRMVADACNVPDLLAQQWLETEFQHIKEAA
ncbi:COG5377 Phage-related protein, predicted endonuclease [uncultured Caudovirales phage]|uniref:COG5377 Phage-related protein, predicted endonuclease n=1 Tax=uncultured Caudovirales phage TaxID=2100421 RepID=A0A6J5QSY3_9CAUD|nr:COG5377 Phage-related protein, predicted endonuclease [uncultured Caudovirales phage]